MDPIFTMSTAFEHVALACGVSVARAPGYSISVYSVDNVDAASKLDVDSIIPASDMQSAIEHVAALYDALPFVQAVVTCRSATGYVHRSCTIVRDSRRVYVGSSAPASDVETLVRYARETCLFRQLDIVAKGSEIDMPIVCVSADTAIRVVQACPDLDVSPMADGAFRFTLRAKPRARPFDAAAFRDRHVLHGGKGATETSGYTSSPVVALRSLASRNIEFLRTPFDTGCTKLTAASYRIVEKHAPPYLSVCMDSKFGSSVATNATVPETFLNLALAVRTAIDVRLRYRERVPELLRALRGRSFLRLIQCLLQSDDDVASSITPARVCIGALNVVKIRGYIPPMLPGLYALCLEVLETQRFSVDDVSAILPSWGQKYPALLVPGAVDMVLPAELRRRYLASPTERADGLAEAITRYVLGVTRAPIPGEGEPDPLEPEDRVQVSKDGWLVRARDWRHSRDLATVAEAFNLGVASAMAKRIITATAETPKEVPRGKAKK